MKTLYESLLDDFDTLEANSNPISTIRKFIEDNYNYNNELKISKKPNKNGYYEVSINGDVDADFDIQSLTNGIFIWKQVKGVFNCEECNNLTSLEGSPREVQGFFDCSYCPNLKSLEGAPDYVRDSFYCTGNSKLKSLKGGPKIVDGPFYCTDCGKQFKEKDIINAKIIVRGGINI